MVSLNLPLNKETKRQPHNVELEKFLLGVLLSRNSEVGAVASFLRPDHFYIGAHQRIYEAIVTGVQEGKQVTPITLQSVFDCDKGLEDLGGAGYLVQLMANAHVSAPLQSVAESLLNLSKRRRLMELGDMLYYQAAEIGNTDSVDDLEAQFFNEFDAIRSDAKEDKTSSVTDNYELIVTEACENRPCYPTGIERFDKALLGGLFAGRTIVVAAPSKAGKTIFAGTISYNLEKQGVPHTIIAAEMGAKELCQRRMARDLSVNPEEIITATQKSNPELVDKMAKLAVTYKQDCVKFVDEPGITFSRLKQQLYTAVHKHGAKGYVLDYFQLVSGENNGESKASFYQRVSDWLVTFNKREKVFGIWVCQLNREEKLYGSDGMLRAADAIYHLHKSDKHPAGWSYLRCDGSRHTRGDDIGTEDNPCFRINPKGLFFESI